MSRRRRTAATGVSLFPFLDVLICTMGSLILLLIVVTKKVQPAIAEKARQAAIAAKLEQAATEVTDEVPVTEVIKSSADDSVPEDNSLNEWRTQIETLASERDLKQTQLTALERKLLAAQAATKRTQELAASKHERLQAIRESQQQAVAERKRLVAEATVVREELSAAEQRLAEAKENQKTARSKFAFVPFDGRTGTTRRPILIECTETFIRFVPEDIRLTSEELNGFTTGFNPLLNASRELVHFWNVYDRVHAEEAETDETTDKDLLSFGSSGKEPYVLLLVRPNGAMSFLIAKNFLAKLKIPHGYELLDDGMELEFSEPNPDAQKVCQQAIEETLSERGKVMQLVAGNRALQSDQLQLDPNNRAFVPIESGESAKSAVGTRSPSSNGLPNKTSASTAGLPRGREGGSEPFSPNSNGVGAVGDGRPESSGTLADRAAVKRPLDDRMRSSGVRPESDFVQAKTDQTSGGGGSKSSTKPNGPSNRRGRPEGADLGAVPPEETLPRSSSSLANDDSKPFPLGQPNRTAKSTGGTATSQSRPTSSSSGRESSGSTANNARPSGSPTGEQSGPGQRSSGSGDIRQHKKRYAMSRAGIGLEKAIPIRIWSNRILVGEEFEIPVDANVRTESLVNRVLIGLDQVQASWPSAGVGYHWVPTLRYEVVPGGDQVQQRLNSALFDLGLVSSVTFLDADPDAPAKPKNTTSPKKSSPSNSGQTMPPREPSRARAAVSVGTRTPIGGDR